MSSSLDVISPAFRAVANRWSEAERIVYGKIKKGWLKWNLSKII